MVLNLRGFSKRAVKHKDQFAKIRSCLGCQLGYHRRHVVIGRGSIPANLLFMGIAPGKTEDLLEEAFVGASGILLNIMINEAAIEANIDVPSHYCTNIVLCRSWVWEYGDDDEEEDNHGKNIDPTREYVAACMKNVMQIISEVDPIGVIFVGKLPEKYYKKEFPESIRITHPASHLQYGGRSSPTYLYDIRNMSEYFKRLF